MVDPTSGTKRAIVANSLHDLVECNTHRGLRGLTSRIWHIGPACITNRATLGNGGLTKDQAANLYPAEAYRAQGKSQPCWVTTILNQKAILCRSKIGETDSSDLQHDFGPSKGVLRSSLRIPCIGSRFI